MKTRIDAAEASPESFSAVYALESFVAKESGLNHELLHLLKIRASQINGCAYCVDMHVKEARAAGLSDQWIALICVWRESPVYTAQERAVLAWTEAITTLSESGAPDADFEELRAHFSDEDIVKLTLAVGVINVWNRFAVGFRSLHPIDSQKPN